MLGLALSTLKRDDTGRVAWLTTTSDLMAEADATEEDLDGIVNYPLAVGEIEVVAFFKEISPGVFRISLRSKGQVNVAKVAEKFGGGGHRNASGCTIKGELSKISEQVVSHLQETLGIQPLNGSLNGKS
jgi:phosphoesterase RecJ-like protein